jgi:glycosyltransferase involved in cell wall biosynthesis
MGESRKPITQLITKHQIEERVFFTGDVSEEMLAKYYNAADLFVFPSFYEGFGLPIIEAMACGCPVIASNTTSIPEVVGDAGILVDPDNPHQISQSIIEILGKREMRDSLIERGLSRIIGFDWEEAMRKTVKIYERL